ncbi:hypothetical protein P885DRAFT_60488 [Corynascus similis CBS 632.67]
MKAAKMRVLATFQCTALPVVGACMLAQWIFNPLFLIEPDFNLLKARKPVFLLDNMPLFEPTSYSAGSPTPTAILGRSSPANTAPVPTAAPCGQAKRPMYNVDRYLEQGIFDNGTVYGRVPDYKFCPEPYAYLSCYKARATSIIADFEIKFGAQRNNRARL